MTEKGLALIKEFEGFEPNAYWDATGKVWTIGYGATFYMDDTSVKKGDTITEAEASKLLEKMVHERFEVYVDQCVTSDINPYQHDALTSFTYNCGIANLKRSTLLKKVNEDPSDQTIRAEFAKWNKSGGKVLNGLTKRRKEEADLYFTEYKGIAAKRDMTPPKTEPAEKKTSEKPADAAKNTTRTAEPVKKTEEQKSFLGRILDWIASLFA